MVSMYRGMGAFGLILAVFGLLLVLDFYVPIGVSIFGLPLPIAGGVMFVLGFLRG